MKAILVKGVICHALFAGALVVLGAGVSGCAMTEPLATEHLQKEAQDPRVSIVLVRFKAPRRSPEKGPFGVISRNVLSWRFAVANESTGWNFRQLDNFSMIFRTPDDSTEPDWSNSVSGWVTFLAPTGSSYIAVGNFAAAEGAAQKLIATPYADHISVARSANPDMSGVWRMDSTDDPRFAVQVSDPRSLIYAGTIVLSTRCGTEEKLSACPYDLAVIDESELARTFIGRYPKGFAGASPMQTQLLTITQSRTIEIRSGSAGTDRIRQ